MARISGVPHGKANLLVRLAYRLSRRRFGQVVEPLSVSAHHPWTFLGYSLFELTIERSRLVDLRLKELASIKVATLVGCPF